VAVKSGGGQNNAPGMLIITEFDLPTKHGDSVEEKTDGTQPPIADAANSFG